MVVVVVTNASVSWGDKSQSCQLEKAFVAGDVVVVALLVVVPSRVVPSFPSIDCENTTAMMWMWMERRSLIPPSYCHFDCWNESY